MASGTGLRRRRLVQFAGLGAGVLLVLPLAIAIAYVPNALHAFCITNPTLARGRNLAPVGLAVAAGLVLVAISARRGGGFWVHAARGLAASCLVLLVPAALLYLTGTPFGDACPKAQWALRTTLIEAKWIRTETGSYSTATASALARRTPELTFLPDRPSTGPRVVSVHSGADGSFRAAALGLDGMCLWIRDDERQGTVFGRGRTLDCRASVLTDEDYSTWS